MPKANVSNIEIEYETIGDPISKLLLLIAGLGSQMLAWSDEMCENLANRGKIGNAQLYKIIVLLIDILTVYKKSINLM